MPVVKPFAALRPEPQLAARICELPYDVVSSEEARKMASGNPLSFFHVSKPEIDLSPEISCYSAEVYQQGKKNFQKLIDQAALRQDREPRFYIYRQVMGSHVQTGLVAVASCVDYLSGRIKKHELTRPDKEDDRVRHLEALEAQTGPVFLVYPARELIDKLIQAKTAKQPEIDFVASDGVRHSSWTIADRAGLSAIENELGRAPSFYIADGDHRCAAAARVYQSRQGAGQSGFFLSVIFP